MKYRVFRNSIGKVETIDTIKTSKQIKKHWGYLLRK